MAKKTAPLLPSSDRRLHRLGARLRLARMRRRLTAKQVAERAGMAPMTLRNVERGGAGVTMGAYLAVMQVLGVDEDLDRLAEMDPLGHDLQDARLSARDRPASLRSPGKLPGKDRYQRAPLAGSDRQSGQTAEAIASVQRSGDGGSRDRGKTTHPRVEHEGYASAQALAGLIKPARTRR